MFLRLKTFVILCCIFLCTVLIHLAIFQHRTLEENYIENTVPSNEEYSVPHMPEKSVHGHMGDAVVVPFELMQRSKDTHYINEFNLVASEMIGNYRELPDYRHQDCLTDILPLPEQLRPLATSVIIVFHNEAQSTLYRSIHSAIYTTPKYLLHEIILVDDASTLEFLHEELEDYVKTLPVTVKIVRVGQRSGLINARILGAEKATGGTLTFLDAHIECTTGWLEHLLAEIVKNRKSVVCPIIDIIDDDNFGYIKVGAESTWGGFDWDLTFHWYHTDRMIPHARMGSKHSSPIKSPAMAGGLFTIERNYFYEIGAYDPGMEIWGGENVEMSLRIWTCGGQLLLHPCSRVGHVFRDKSPYSWPGGVNHILTRNMMRTSEVWMDEYKLFYRKSHPKANFEDMGDISARVKLRKDLACKPFSWYLENVYPESTIPRDTIALGQVINDGTNSCLDSGGKKVNTPVEIAKCHGFGGHQVLAYNKGGLLRFNNNLCLSVYGVATEVKIKNCIADDNNQFFKYENKKLIHTKTNSCLEVFQDITMSYKIRLAACSEESDYQDWTMEPFHPKDGQ